MDDRKKSRQQLIEELGRLREVLAIVESEAGVTESQRAKAALRISEEQVRQAVRAANLGLFDHDHCTDVIHWSTEMRQMCGIGLKEAISTSMILEFYPPKTERRSQRRSGGGTIPRATVSILPTPGSFAVTARFVG